MANSDGSKLYYLAFKSNIEKSLGEAIELEFLDAENKICPKHLYNLKKFFIIIMATRFKV